MNLKNILKPEYVCFLQGQTKEAAILELVDLVVQDGHSFDIDELKQELFYREKLMSTGIGLGIGIPHVRIKNVGDPVVAIGIRSAGISDYESLDHQPVKIVILIIVEKEKHKDHVKLLSQIMAQLKDETVRDQLLCAAGPDKIYQLMTQ